MFPQVRGLIEEGNVVQEQPSEVRRQQWHTLSFQKRWYNWNEQEINQDVSL